MRLLICTQAIDSADHNLGFFVRWVEELSRHCERVIVVCLRRGEAALPPNVEVIALGERNRLLRALELCVISFGRRSEYDAVFVHMSPEFTAAAGWLWRMLGKRLGLWYVHRSVTPYLHLATALSHVVFSASRQSFRIPSAKLHITGHGIDVDRFAAPRRAHETLAILTFGRIAESKGLREMLAACDELHRRGRAFEFRIAGAPITARDKDYEHALRNDAQSRDYVSAIHFLGPVTHDRVPMLLQDASVTLNLSETGSLDKAVLESLAAGVPAVTSNPAFKDIVPKALFVPQKDPASIADALEASQGIDMAPFVEYIRTHHGLAHVVDEIITTLKHA